MRRVLSLLAISAFVAALAGCGSSSDPAQRMALRALNTPVAQGTTTKPEPKVSCRNPTASLRPPAVMPTPGAMPAGSFMAHIERHGKLVAGVDQNSYRLAYFNPLDGTPEGFEIALVHDLARAIFGDPNRVSFVATTTGERIQYVRSGLVDIVVDAATITCYRRTQVYFSTVYDDAGQRLLVPIKSPIHSVNDLAGKRVCVTKAPSTSLTTLEQKAPRAIPYQVSQRTDCLVALQQGLVDAITSDDAILLGFAAQDPYTKLVGASFAPEPYGMEINKAHPDFVRFVNGVLAQMRRDGTWRSTYSHWLGKFGSTPAPPPAHYNG
jgi:polar amino acid transport system substrate-binding protein